ncbi:MAG: hypothetical protein J6V13_06840 [Paludibacteraceae bacterium]|nr:hypothetical protein [Paludibacteraceae bacterium]
MKFFYYLFLIGFMAVSCQSETDTQKAERYLDQARRSVAESHYNQAKILLDSIHECYPREVAVRRMAKHLADTISVIENERTVFYCDSLIPLKYEEINNALKNFRREDDTAYIDEARYVHRLLRTENNALRCYLQAKVGEKGTIFLKSMYCGRPIEHHLVELHNNAFSVKAKGDNVHAFKLDNTHCETLMFAQNEALSLLNFINEYAQERIEVMLVGASSSYSYVLMESERKAMAESYALSVLLSDYERLMQERRRADIRRTQSQKRLSLITQDSEE